jgi:hypothetical protein
MRQADFQKIPSVIQPSRGFKTFFLTVYGIWSLLGNFFYFTLKGFHHKISKKPKDALNNF